jgi:GNAT superfamily N-acetyltransferase
MSSIVVRPFRRSDGWQLAALVNAHAAAVVPGVSVSVNAVLSQLEREPGEFIVDPWVVERTTLVAEQRSRVVAAAHLLRYGSHDDVGESYRDVGEIRWFVSWPEAPFWPDAADARDVLVEACVAQLDRWAVARQYADGSLPAPGVYGIPDQWPHIGVTFERAGFVHEGKTEIIYLASVEDLPRVDEAPIAGLAVRRSVGINGTRFSAVVDGEVVGFVEVEAFWDAGRAPRQSGLGDVGNLQVVESHRRRGIGSWLVALAADWLRLGGVDRLLEYAWPEDEDVRAFLQAIGFRELTRTRRGWVRPAVPLTSSPRRA